MINPAQQQQQTPPLQQPPPQSQGPKRERKPVECHHKASRVLIVWSSKSEWASSLLSVECGTFPLTCKNNSIDYAGGSCRSEALGLLQSCWVFFSMENASLVDTMLTFCRFSWADKNTRPQPGWAWHHRGDHVRWTVGHHSHSSTGRKAVIVNVCWQNTVPPNLMAHDFFPSSFFDWWLLYFFIL